MSKMFVHYSGTVDAFSKLSNIADYNNKIVFIKGDVDGKGAAIYTHGEYYTTPHAVIKGVLIDNDINTALYSSDHNGMINFITDENIKVETKEGGVAISFQKDFEEWVTQTKTDIITIKGVSTDTSSDDSIYGVKKYSEEKASEAEENAKKYSDDNFVKVSEFNELEIEAGAEVNVIETVKVNGTALTPDSNKAVNIVIPAATVTGVKSGDKVLSMNGTELMSTLSFVKETIDNSEYLVIRGVDNTIIGLVDTADFTADAFLVNVELLNDNLVFTFNTESGLKTIYVDISKYIDTYTAGNGISITNKVVSAKLDSSSESFLTVGANGIKLAGVQTAINTAVANKNVDASGDAYVTATADNNKVTVAATTSTKNSLDRADSALQSVEKGSDGEFVTTTVSAKYNNTQTIGVSVMTQSVADSTSTYDGLATAYDVKSYADALFAWEEL